jgi:membrane protein
VGASHQAGAVTYFAFLSFFPILALAFFVVGWVSKVYPDAQRDLVKAIDQVLPDLVGNREGQVSITAIQDAAQTIALLGLAGVLYAGLGWITAMRDALEVVFELPKREQPSFVRGKVRDLVSLATIGVVLIVSVAVAGFVTGFSGLVLDWVSLDAELGWFVTLIGRVIGFAANALLFFALFRLLAQPHAPKRSLWSGAMLGAVAFEVLKALSFLLLAATEDQPAFQAFGIALILVVWINYFSRVVLYAAAWAHTSAAAREIREHEAFERARMHQLTRVDLHEAPLAAPDAAPGRPLDTKSFAAGGAATLALVALLRRKKDTS